MYLSYQQLLTVVLWLTQSMAELVTVEKQHMDIELLTVVIQAITWWAAVFEDVTLQEGGLEVLLPVKVCCYCI